jgi:hypothetical protein
MTDEEDDSECEDDKNLDIAFHKADSGFSVSINGEMADAEQIDDLAVILNEDEEVRDLIKSRLGL